MSKSSLSSGDVGSSAATKVRLQEVRKSYGSTEVLHGVNLDIRRGEFITILGPSGCGKSTLLRLIAGLERISSGVLAIEGRVVNELSPHERNIAMVFQNYALYPHMSVFDNIAYSLRIAGMSRAEIDRRVRETSDMLGLGNLLLRRPSQLSGGQRQRVAMGRAIVRSPTVFLFDEPLSNLDTLLRVQMRTELKRLHRSLDATTVMVTHDQTEAMSMASRIVVMNGGRVEQIGSPLEVYHRPATRFVGSFIGAPPMNFFAGHYDTAAAGIILDGGEKILVRLPEARDGQALDVGIRPENLTPGSDGCAVLTGAIDLVEELGSEAIIHLTGASGSFVSAMPESSGLSGEVQLSVRPEHVHVFDGTSGQRLAA